MADGMQAPALIGAPAYDPFERPFSVSLHGLRGVAALCVFFNHFADFINHPSVILSPLAWLSGGLEAVALFFILSGAVLGMSLRRFRLQFSAYRSYAARRAIRLLPVVIVATSLGAFYASFLRFTGPSDVLAPEFFRYYHSDRHLADLLFSWTGLYAGLDPPMWSIYVEIVGSVLLPFFVLASRRLGGCLALVAVLMVVSALCSGADGRFARNAWPVYMVNFALGLLACHVAARVPAILRRLSSAQAATAAVILYLLLMNLHDALGLARHGHFVGNLLDSALSFFLVVLLLAREDRPYGERMLHWLGDISYPLYLLHWPIMCLLLTTSLRLVGETWALTHPEAYAVGNFALALGACLMLSQFVFVHIEQPAIAWGKARFGRARPIS